MIMGSIPWAPHLAWPLVAGTTLISFIPPTTVLGPNSSSPPRARGEFRIGCGPQDIGAGLGAATGMALTGSIAMAVFGRGWRPGCPEDLRHELDTATQTPPVRWPSPKARRGHRRCSARHGVGGLVLGTVAAHAAVFVLNLMTLVVAIRGLRGRRCPTTIRTPIDRGSGGPLGSGCGTSASTQLFGSGHPTGERLGRPSHRADPP